MQTPRLPGYTGPEDIFENTEPKPIAQLDVASIALIIHTKTTLSRREAEVLANLYAFGKSNTQIGEDLFITEKCVKFHFTNIYKKLKVINRTSAMIAVSNILAAK